MNDLDARVRGQRKVITTVYLGVRTLAQLKALSQATKRPMGSYIREGIQELLKRKDMP